jgi:hypothetical protein
MGTAGPGDGGDYARRLRSLPADEVLREFLFSLLNTAQVKLGRRDARLLIDVTAVAHDHARHYLPDDLTRQIDQMLGQLRMSQVNAEGRAGHDRPEENDLDRLPAPPSASAGQ